MNEKVDVFSFGVVMWEIWTWAEQPYPGLGLPEIFAVSLSLSPIKWKRKTMLLGVKQENVVSVCLSGGLVCFTVLPANAKHLPGMP